MKASGRYLFLGVFLLALGFLAYRHNANWTSLEHIPSYISEVELWNRKPHHASEWPVKMSECSMSRCFNLLRCLAQDAFRVYVYPSDNESTMSVVYNNILKVIRESKYFTSDPQKACVFILSIDTVDRDRRSENYVKYVDELIAKLPTEIWNYGRNHIIFNLYHGTYPNYSDHDLGFDTGYAIIARASANAQMFRENFDLSFPLFHEQHPLRTTVEPGWSLKLKNKYLVSFKGKRYVYGIGSETRDSLYHLHNGQSVVIVTTCKHNADWKKYKDERCEEDNIEYDHWDYEATMSNSTFCLTPRGRRLGSFRFLEALRLGCIPVVLSDDWELPFSEVIDWRQAVIIGHEDTVLTISDLLSAIPIDRILFMKQQSRGLYQRYFSSVEKIVLTSLTIIEERIKKQKGEAPMNWNRVTQSIESEMISSSTKGHCTVFLRASVKASGRLNRIVHLLSAINGVQKIIIFWPNSREVMKHIESDAKVTVQMSDFDLLSDVVNETLQTKLVGEFVLFLDERVTVSSSDIHFLLDVANTEPSRLYGFYAGGLKVQERTQTIELTASSQYSMVLLHFALMKREYLAYFEQWVPIPARKIATRSSQCLALLLNMMIAELTGRSPVLIGNRIHEKWMLTKNYTDCLNKLVADVWPTGPSLINSQTRLDPFLYRDQLATF